jgi:hypothetical protein
MSRILTQYFPNLLESESATFIYEYLKNDINWKLSIKGRKGMTRLSYPADIEDDILAPVITSVLEHISENGKNKFKQVLLLSVYLNYYKNGNMYTPNHSHPGTCQVIISLGAARTLNVAKKSYQINNGNVIIFGSSTHGIPREYEIKRGRISIALFCKLIN